MAVYEVGSTRELFEMSFLSHVIATDHVTPQIADPRKLWGGRRFTEFSLCLGGQSKSRVYINSKWILLSEGS